MERGSSPKVESSTPFEKKSPLVEVDAQRRSPDPTRGGSACCEGLRKGEGENKDVPLFGGQFSSLVLATLRRGAGVPPRLPALWYGWKRPSMLGVEGMMLRKEGRWTRIGPGVGGGGWVGRDMGKLDEEGRALSRGPCASIRCGASPTPQDRGAARSPGFETRWWQGLHHGENNNVLPIQLKIV